jgi:hypothetical protein
MSGFPEERLCLQSCVISQSATHRGILPAIFVCRDGLKRFVIAIGRLPRKEQAQDRQEVFVGRHISIHIMQKAHSLTAPPTIGVVLNTLVKKTGNANNHQRAPRCRC